METCIKDLEQRFARVPLTVSPPLVAFRESCLYLPEAPAEAPEGPRRAPTAPRVVEATTANGYGK